MGVVIPIPSPRSQIPNLKPHNIMKSKHYAILVAAFIAGWFFASMTFGQIVGPTKTQAGTLAVFETTEPADWSVSPSIKTTGMYFPDSTGTKLYFASPIKGDYEINAAVILDGKPTLLTFAFVNGEGVSPGPSPEPEPTPQPKTLADWVKENIPSNAKQEEINTMASAFSLSASGIERNTIRTIDQAFAVIRTQANRYDGWNDFLAGLTDREELKTENVKTLGTVFDEVGKSLEGKNSVEFGAERSLELKTENSKLKTQNSKLEPDCSTGDCPTSQKPQTQRFRRW